MRMSESVGFLPHIAVLLRVVAVVWKTQFVSTVGKRFLSDTRHSDQGYSSRLCQTEDGGMFFGDEEIFSFCSPR